MRRWGRRDKINWKARPNITLTALSRGGLGRYSVQESVFIVQVMNFTSLTMKLLFKNAVGAKWPVTFTALKKVLSLLVPVSGWIPLISCLAIPWVYRTLCQMVLFLVRIPAGVLCSVTEIMSRTQETIKASVKNRPKQNHLIKDDLTLTSRPSSD